jgi:YgiT-type zinc finger domain-containing protein
VILPDFNVLVYAHNTEFPDHAEYRVWWESVVNGPAGYTPDGRCVSLLKILLTNVCIYDCQYCINRQSSNVERARFTPDEVVEKRVTVVYPDRRGGHRVIRNVPAGVCGQCGERCVHAEVAVEIERILSEPPERLEEIGASDFAAAV